MEMKVRARIAAAHYLKLTGRQVICDDFLDRFIVAKDDEGLAFIDVFYTTDGMSAKQPKIKRDVFEDAIYKFFMQDELIHDLLDMRVRYDTIELFICGDDRAVIRHHIDAGLEG